MVINYFLICALKNILGVLVKTSSLRQFQRVPTFYVLNINKKNVIFCFVLFLSSLNLSFLQSFKVAEYCIGMFGNDTRKMKKSAKLTTKRVTVEIVVFTQ